MSDLNENKLPEEALSEVSGGIGIGRGGSNGVRPITPCWVRVTASSLNCRYAPSTSAEIAKKYERGHKLKVDGITNDGKWYRLLIYDPKGGTCYAYIYKAYTEEINY